MSAEQSDVQSMAPVVTDASSSAAPKGFLRLARLGNAIGREPWSDAEKAALNLESPAAEAAALQQARDAQVVDPDMCDSCREQRAEVALVGCPQDDATHAVFCRACRDHCATVWGGSAELERQGVLSSSLITGDCKSISFSPS